ncbi:MAG: hypothetical protein K8S94_15445 [Planctomycetia bacterium]|nr:hypothetical protein [Planctomycetia bacterium]
MIRSFASCLLLAVCGLVVVAPLVGCGGTKKKKPRMTFGDMVEKAKKDTTPGGPARELARVARLQLKSGDKAGAKKTLQEARKTIADDADPAVFAPRLIEIAAAYATVDDKKAAREGVDKAVVMAASVSDPVARVEVLSKAGRIYGGSLGDTTKAKDSLAKAAEIAAGDDVSDRFRPQALAAVALGYADANLAGDATKVIDQLETLATSLEELRPKAEALAAAANVRFKSGEKPRAADLLKEAATAAKAIDGSANKTYALIAVANAMIAAGDKKGATALAAEAEKTGGKISDAEQQKDAMQEVRTLEAALKD